VRDGGYYAIESLRLEKGYRAFGRELTADYSPVEAGLLFTCKLKTDLPFLGRESVERIRKEGPRRKLVGLRVDDPEVLLWGGELLVRDDEPAGQVMSGAWGATVGASVGLGYVWDPAGQRIDADWVRAGSYEVDVAGARRPVTVSFKPVFDPTNARIRPT
jgi:4-methylaminobutanoate oxidase (formaldehyde-forming)